MENVASVFFRPPCITPLKTDNSDLRIIAMNMKIKDIFANLKITSDGFSIYNAEY